MVNLENKMVNKNQVQQCFNCDVIEDSLWLLCIIGSRLINSVLIVHMW